MFGKLQKLRFGAERGQVVVLVALMVPVLLGMTGMAVDIGSYASDRRDLQNAADAIALAAAQELPDNTKAQAAANQWAQKNGIAPSDMQVNVIMGQAAPTVRVRLQRNHDFTFVRVVGITDKDVNARAAAVKVSPAGMQGVVPWGVKKTAVDAAPNGGVVTVKYDSNNVQNGNFGPIRVDGTDDTAYGYGVQYGTTANMCSVSAAKCTTTDCPGPFPTGCAETAPECDGPDCRVKTGNVIGVTRDAVNYRMTYTSADCDTFEEAFGTPDATGTYNLSYNCNPWIGPGECPDGPTSPVELCSRRVMIIPVINDFGSGSSDAVTVLEFALVWLEGYDSDMCKGSDCEIQVRFVKADVTTNALAGTYDPGSLIHFVRLSE